MKGLYFNDENEPDEFIFEFKKAMKEISEKNGKAYIDISYADREAYDKIMNEIVDFNNDKVKVFGTSNDKIIITIENDTDDDLNEEIDSVDVDIPNDGDDE